MHKPLPKAWFLITESWASFIKHWNESIKISVWFIYFGLVSFATSILLKISGSAPFTIVAFLISLVVGVGFLWAGIRVIQAMLEIEDGKKPSLDLQTSKKALHLIIPIMIIGILQLVCTLGGLLFFIVPGIYLAVALSFSQLSCIEGGKRYFEALAASLHMVRGRWWHTLWLMISGNLLFGFALVIITSIISGLLATLAGFDPSSLSGANAFKVDPLLEGAFNLLQNVMQAAIMPLFITYQVKLYSALKSTQEKV